MDSEKVRNEMSYITKTTTARLNYRISCDFEKSSIAGVLELGESIKIIDGWQKFAHGHTWFKAKIGRKHYFVCADWLV